MELARDAVQSAWTLAWCRQPSLRDPAQVRPWLVAIAATEARGALRRRRRPGPTLELDNILDTAGGADPADGIAIVDPRRTLARLDPDDRALNVRWYRAGRTVDGPDLPLTDPTGTTAGRPDRIDVQALRD